MAPLKGDMQRVFQAYQPLFVGQNALIRRRKAILTKLLTYQCPPSDLLADLSLHKIVDILQSLLKDNVFASEDAGKHDPKPSQAYQTVQGGYSANTWAPKGSLKDTGDNSVSEGGDGECLVGKTVEVEKSQTEEDKTAGPNRSLMSSMHVTSRCACISYQIQHLILTKTQSLLEQACFDFTTKWAPELILRETWDCPEAIELSKWTVAVTKALDEIPIDAFRTEDYPNIKGIFHSSYELRNISVHRVRISLDKLEGLVQNAVQFLAALCDNSRALRLGKMQAIMGVFMRSLEMEKESIESRLQDELSEIHRLREALDIREKKAVEAMRGDNMKVNNNTASLLEYSFEEMFREGHYL
ncbi:hypothetical protein MaudCBS49596_004257 [Microsporum audouinii]